MAEARARPRAWVVVVAAAAALAGRALGQECREALERCRPSHVVTRRRCRMPMCSSCVTTFRMRTGVSRGSTFSGTRAWLRLLRECGVWGYGWSVRPC